MNGYFEIRAGTVANDNIYNTPWKNMLHLEPTHKDCLELNYRFGPNIIALLQLANSPEKGIILQTGPLFGSEILYTIKKRQDGFDIYDDTGNRYVLSLNGTKDRVLQAIDENGHEKFYIRESNDQLINLEKNPPKPFGDCSVTEGWEFYSSENNIPLFQAYFNDGRNSYTGEYDGRMFVTTGGRNGVLLGDLDTFSGGDNVFTTSKVLGNQPLFEVRNENKIDYFVRKRHALDPFGNSSTQDRPVCFSFHFTSKTSAKVFHWTNGVKDSQPLMTCKFIKGEFN